MSKKKKLKKENKRLKNCLNFALYLRPLPSDPFQVFVAQQCPGILKKWRKNRGWTDEQNIHTEC
jgi:hypothetical protein